MLFKIVNPSDPYTIESSSLDVAAVAVILLGNGHFSLSSLDGGESVPFFAFGGTDEWCQKNFKESLIELCNRVMDTKLSEIADSLDSVLYGDEEDRVQFLAESKDMDRATFEAARLIRQDEKRSSINDIGERAYRMAAQLRKSIQEGISTLQ